MPLQLIINDHPPELLSEENNNRRGHKKMKSGLPFSYNFMPPNSPDGFLRPPLQSANALLLPQVNVETSERTECNFILDHQLAIRPSSSSCSNHQPPPYDLLDQSNEQHFERLFVETGSSHESRESDDRRRRGQEVQRELSISILDGGDQDQIAIYDDDVDDDGGEIADFNNLRLNDYQIKVS